jgi:Ca2+-transporting ATPase
VTLGVFAWALVARDLDEARSLAFMTLVFAELFRAFAARSPTKVFWQTGVFGNVVLIGVVFASVLLQLAICHMQWTRTLFQLAEPSPGHTAIGLVLGLVPVTVLELAKLAARRVPTARGPRADASSAQFRPAPG